LQKYELEDHRNLKDGGHSSGTSVLCMCDDAILFLALLSFSQNVNHKGRAMHEDEGNTSRACLEASCSSPKSRPGMVIDRMAVEMPEASM
jgi:hypothetical protein